MVRRFTDEAIPEPSLERILSNARRGPSAGFSQGQAFLVLRGDALARFWDIASHAIDDSVRTAQVVVLPCACKDIYLERYSRPDKGWTDKDEARWPVPFWFIDTGMATLLMLQTVVDEGLGALYFGIYPEAVPVVKAEFGIPEEFEPIGGVAIGHIADQPRTDTAARRRPLHDLVHHDHWGSPE